MKETIQALAHAARRGPQQVQALLQQAAELTEAVRVAQTAGASHEEEARTKAADARRGFAERQERLALTRTALEGELNAMAADVAALHKSLVAARDRLSSELAQVKARFLAYEAGVEQQRLQLEAGATGTEGARQQLVAVKTRSQGRLHAGQEGISQALSALGANVEAQRSQATKHVAYFAEVINTTHRDLDQAMREMRIVLRKLETGFADELGQVGQTIERSAAEQTSAFADGMARQVQAVIDPAVQGLIKQMEQAIDSLQVDGAALSELHELANPLVDSLGGLIGPLQGAASAARESARQLGAEKAA